MFKKLTMIAGLLGGSALFSGQALAAADWGPCTADTVHTFSAVLNNTITDTSQNASGTIMKDFWSWDLGGTYNAVCECPEGTEQTPVLYKASSPLIPGQNVGGRQFYVVDRNIQISADVFIGGDIEEYKTIPFDNETNGISDRAACDVTSSATFSTGSKGKLTLYIDHPFVGKLDIPNTKIMDVYGTRKSNVYGSSPLSSVFFSGSVIVPQGCELSSGSTLEIPFGEFKASDFKDRKGQIAKNATKFTKELQFKCSNISDGVKIFLHIEGMPNANDSNAIDMGNPDIGAVIEGANGKILVPNDISVNQELSVSALVDETHRTASTTISAYPISTTGKLPKAGEFEGIATMRIDVE
ncbi:long polar fimbrial protein LpfD [Enterobacter asburiae]